MIALKKLTYLSLAFGLTILFIFVCILSQFGARINSSDTFQGFFGWYITLLLINILYPCANLKSHFFVRSYETAK